MLKKRLLLYGLGFMLLLLLLTIWVCNSLISRSAAGRLFADTGSIPYNKTGLLLGTAKRLSGGSINPYYQYRIDAAVDLVKAGKISYLVISGDNGRADYNEPADMKQDLIDRGVDSNIIYLDYAGFRTYDSMVRLKEIFGQDSVTVISQPFHNERAIYLGSTLDIAAIGFNAKDVEGSQDLRVKLREKLARVKVFIDGAAGTKPRFLGEKVQIGDREH
ncbi:MAG TPA: ElyC/SanA/YdcF family protein [Flavisolibacter sp.]|nr:ElyC/SanA/YdcF family protein [Flavisolibacter sp.]